MNKAGTDPTTVVPRLVAQFAPPQADNVVAVIEAGPGETIEAARADFARMLGLTAQVNELVDQLAMAAADPVTSTLAKRHLQLALLAEFAERCAGGPVATHQPLRELLAELEGKLRAES